MSDKEIILLFKKDSCMTERDWERFCKRYALRDISSVTLYIKESYGTAYSVSKGFVNALRKEMKSCVC